MGQIRVILDDCNGPLNLVRHRQQNGLVTKPCQRAGATHDTIQKGIAREGAMSQSPISGQVQRLRQVVQAAGGSKSQSPVSGQVQRTCRGQAPAIFEAGSQSPVSGQVQRTAGFTANIKTLAMSQSPVSGQVQRTPGVACITVRAYWSQSPVSGQVRRTFLLQGHSADT